MQWLFLADGIPHFICKQGKAVRLPLCYNSKNAPCVIALCDAAVRFCDHPPFSNLDLTLPVYLPMYIVSCVIGLPVTGVHCESHSQWLFNSEATSLRYGVTQLSCVLDRLMAWSHRGQFLGTSSAFARRDWGKREHPQDIRYSGKSLGLPSMRQES